jgi:hypothetical protein
MDIFVAVGGSQCHTTGAKIIRPIRCGNVYRQVFTVEYLGCQYGFKFDAIRVKDNQCFGFHFFVLPLSYQGSSPALMYLGWTAST